MNLTDLTDELQVRAGEAIPVRPPQGEGSLRLTRVRHRIRNRRHRRAASAAAVTAICIAVVVLAPGLPGLRADRAPTTPVLPGPIATPTPVTVVPDPTEPASVEDFVPDPAIFRKDLGGDLLIASGKTRLGTGDAELAVTFTPTGLNLGISRVCRNPRASGGGDVPAAMISTTTVNGHKLSPVQCGADTYPDEPFAFSDDPAVNRARWADLGVRVGKPSELRIVIAREAGIPENSQIGAGVYELEGARVVSDGVTLKKTIKLWRQDMNVTADGIERGPMKERTYVLQDYRTAIATPESRRLALPTPASAQAGLIVGGSPNNHDLDSKHRVKLTLDGEGRTATSGPGLGMIDLDDDPGPHTAEVRLDKTVLGTIPNAEMVIAYYRLVRTRTVK